MRYFSLLLLLALLATAARAQLSMTGAGSVAGGGAPGPPANALLSQTGVCIEAQAGSCIMVQ
jgi:hypothetical protein